MHTALTVPAAVDRILTYVRDGECTNRTLLDCIRVSPLWHSRGLPLVYEKIHAWIFAEVEFERGIQDYTRGAMRPYAKSACKSVEDISIFLERTPSTASLICELTIQVLPRFSFPSQHLGQHGIRQKSFFRLLKPLSSLLRLKLLDVWLCDGGADVVHRPLVHHIHSLSIQYLYLCRHVCIPDLISLLSVIGHADNLVVQEFGHTITLLRSIDQFKHLGPVECSFRTDHLTIDLDGGSASAYFLDAFRLCSSASIVKKYVISFVGGETLVAFSDIIATMRHSLENLEIKIFEANYDTSCECSE